MQLLEITKRIGRKLQKIFQEGLTFNVFIDGKKYLILAWSKVLGQRKRIEWFFYLFKKRVLKNGPK